jgi:hypothetical protein
VHHLDEVTGTSLPAVQVAKFGAGGLPGAAGGPGSGLDTGRDGREQRPQPLHHLRLTADHQAVAAIEAPDATACADVEIVNPLLVERGGAGDVVAVV